VGRPAQMITCSTWLRLAKSMLLRGCIVDDLWVACGWPANSRMYKRVPLRSVSCLKY
jgi:hypothetical protein